MPYNPQKIEKKWQRIWEQSRAYETKDKVKGRKNFYHLVMLPYTSGDLHIGHWMNFGPADVYARFKRMQGYNVMSPIGFDAFGLPAENAAIKHGVHPRAWTYNNIKKMRSQLKTIGALYDWSREIITAEPDYYKWTQWLFLQLYKAGLAYRAKTPANWCPSCKTILANEQVIEGKCERCDTDVTQKQIEQWLLKITEYADDLLRGLDKVDWPERTKTMQRNWIGRSEGVNITYKIKGTDKKIVAFTTRPDTIFGATYIVVAPEHSIIEDLKNIIENYPEIKKYIEKSKKKTEIERLAKGKEKTGLEIKGIKAINPANNKEIPVWLADYVLMSYGTGAIMAVPAHDQRDFEFAKKYNLPIKVVVYNPKYISKDNILEARPLSYLKDGSTLSNAFEGEGEVINSDGCGDLEMNGWPTNDAKKRVATLLKQKGLAKKTVNYKLRDWIISRQRYWGAPIPMLYCQNCGWQPVPEKELPVLLPNIKDFKPSSEGKSPLAKSKKFVEVKCPKCQGKAKRETDTMDTFVCSSWYFLRYTDPKNKKEFAGREKLKQWLPVDMYIGGAEHTVMHLLYARFFTKALKKLGYLDFSEPFSKLRHQGIILGPDGKKMSKSKGNVIDPDEQVAKYGADAVRMYLCFMGPYEQGGPWQFKGIVGISRFLEKIWHLINLKTQMSNLKTTPKEGEPPTGQASQNLKLKKFLHKTIKKVGKDIENLKFNTAISALMILLNEMQKHNQQSIISEQQLLLKLLAPFAPHITEELWHQLGSKKSIHLEKWPGYDPKLIKEETITLVVQINGRVRDKIETQAEITKQEAKKLALQQEKVQKHIKGRKIKRIVFVPGKIINFVVSEIQ